MNEKGKIWHRSFKIQILWFVELILNTKSVTQLNIQNMAHQWLEHIPYPLYPLLCPFYVPCFPISLCVCPVVPFQHAREEHSFLLKSLAQSLSSWLPQPLDSAFWLPKPHCCWDNDRKADRNHFLESDNTLNTILILQRFFSSLFNKLFYVMVWLPLLLFHISFTTPPYIKEMLIIYTFFYTLPFLEEISSYQHKITSAERRK